MLWEHLARFKKSEKMLKNLKKNLDTYPENLKLLHNINPELDNIM